MAEAFRLAIEGNLQKTVDGASQALLKASAGAMRDEGAAVKARLQGDVIAGLANGAKLAKTWRVTVYPASGLANDPALSILNKSAGIISAFSYGALIHAANGNWLAIPAPEIAPRLSRMGTPRGESGAYVARGQWPDLIAAALGAGEPKFFIAPNGQHGIIYVLKGKARVTIGFLVKQAVLGKRIGGLDLLKTIQETLPATFTARFYEYLDAELAAV